MSPPMIHRAGLFAAVALCVNLLGCDNKLDHADLLRDIENMITEQLHVKVSEVKCPKEVVIRINKKFECQAMLPLGGELPIEVKITDENGSIQMETKYKVLDPKDLRGQGMECGDAVIVLKPGAAINCTTEGVALVGKVDDKGEIAFDGA